MLTGGSQGQGRQADPYACQEVRDYTDFNLCAVVLAVVLVSFLVVLVHRAAGV